MTDNRTPQLRVVVNAEGQYSIWRADRTLPGGWVDAGFVGDENACLGHIESVWTDITPLSVRNRLTVSRGTAPT